MGKPKIRHWEDSGPGEPGTYNEGWNDAIAAWEQWEKERPAKWIIGSVHMYTCNFCGFDVERVGKTCPGCGRKMEG